VVAGSILFVSTHALPAFVSTHALQLSITVVKQQKGKASSSTLGKL